MPCRPTTPDPPVMLTLPKCSNGGRAARYLEDCLFLVSAGVGTCTGTAGVGQRFAIPGI